MVKIFSTRPHQLICFQCLLLLLRAKYIYFCISYEFSYFLFFFLFNFMFHTWRLANKVSTLIYHFQSIFFLYMLIPFLGLLFPHTFICYWWYILCSNTIYFLKLVVYLFYCCLRSNRCNNFIYFGNNFVCG